MVASVIAAVAVILLCTPAGLAKTPDQRRVDTLRALPGIFVVVEELSPEARADGLSAQQIAQDIEFQLRRAGIHIMSEGEWARTPGKPFLYVRVSLAKDGSRYAFHLEVELLQRVRLERYQELAPVQVPTWDTPEEIGVIDGGQIQDIRKYLAVQIDRFIRAYLSVNGV